LQTLAGLDFDEGEYASVPGDHINFSVFCAITGGDDPESERSQVINRLDLGTAAEREESIEQPRKWHFMTRRKSLLKLSRPQTTPGLHRSSAEERGELSKDLLPTVRGRDGNIH